MAHFIGRISGSRGPASRLGTKGSGIMAEAAGWDVGARVEIRHMDGRDIVRVWRTAGSNASTPAVLLAEFEEANGFKYLHGRETVKGGK